MPTALAPSTSSSIESPTITAAAGSTSRRSSAAWKMVGCGFVLPWVVEVAPGVRDEAKLEPVRAELVEGGQDVFEELEVVRMLPGARHLDRTLVGALGVAAHAADDLLREENPDLLVVVELRVAFEGRDCVRTGLAVALWVELEPETLPESPVALRPEIGPRLGDREVDVEENGAERHHSACSSAS